MRFSAPARIDLAGGTIDIPPLCYLVEDSLTLNLAIDLRVTVGVSPGPHENGRQGTLFDEVFRYFAVDKRAHTVAVESRIPRSSGLGGSSSLLVALVHAVDCLGFQDKGAVLKAVTVLEHRILRKPAGTQDGVAALYGGLNAITFERGEARRKALPLPAFLSGPLFLAYSPEQHHSGISNWEIVKAACEGDRRTLDTLNALSRNAHGMHEAIVSEREASFLDALHHEAALRNRLCDSLLTPNMAAFAAALPEDIACKVCGAGGGGCMFLFGKNLEIDPLSCLAKEHGLEIISVMADPRGCVRVIP